MRAPGMKFGISLEGIFYSLLVTRHQNGIFAPVSQTSIRRETVVRVAKCRLFSQATGEYEIIILPFHCLQVRVIQMPHSLRPLP